MEKYKEIAFDILNQAYQLTHSGKGSLQEALKFPSKALVSKSSHLFKKYLEEELEVNRESYDDVMSSSELTIDGIDKDEFLANLNNEEIALKEMIRKVENASIGSVELVDSLYFRYFYNEFISNADMYDKEEVREIRDLYKTFDFIKSFLNMTLKTHESMKQKLSGFESLEKRTIERVDLKECLDEVINYPRIVEGLSRKKAKIVLNYDKILGKVSGNKELLVNEILVNLLVNAIEHGIEKQPIQIILEPLGSTLVRLSIENYTENEIGQDFLDQIFISHGNKASEKGMGIGLIRSKDILRTWGGDMIASSSKESFKMSLIFKISDS
ncbi:MAG: HAMP domain-containing histidine kinase [Oligoflexia bacterium]|nr:HAMP domain-containing histidine kinase [Oligoflexia bacterium]